MMTDSDDGSGSAELLTAPSNYAVVQLPGRRHPGVVFQGDSLAVLCENLRSALDIGDDDERRAGLATIADELDDILRDYLGVLDRAGLRVPFSYRPDPR